MRINSARHKLKTLGVQTGPIDITMTGPLILKSDPANPKQAATKQYVDSRYGSLSVSDIKTGVLPVEVLPAFQGHVSNTQGSNVFTLTTTGVTPGSFNKTTVDVNGRVIAGWYLVSEDFPQLTWNKVYGNKPTTLSGYGISDALNRDGGGVGAGFRLNAVPSDSLHIVNKSFIEDELSKVDRDAITGTLIEHVGSLPPEGYLRCNGGIVNKNTYPELYSVIGDRFQNNGLEGFGQPWLQQYLINRTPGTTLGPWVESPENELPIAINNSKAFVTNGMMYVIPGVPTSGTNSRNIYKAPIKKDGTLGPWILDNLSVNGGAYFDIAVTKNMIYSFGGGSGSGGGRNLEYSEIKPDGTTSAWTAETVNTLPTEVSSMSTFTLKDKLYLIGGRNGTELSTKAYFSTFDSEGKLGAWTLLSNLPFGFSDNKIAVTRNRLFLIGGSIRQGSASVLTTPLVYSAAINSNGSIGTWVRSVPVGTTGTPSSITINGNAYSFQGGVNDTNYETVQHTVTLNPDSANVINTTVPVGGFITVEYRNPVLVNKTYTNSGSFRIPSSTPSITVTGKGSNGTPFKPYNPGQPYIPQTYYTVVEWYKTLQTGSGECYASQIGPFPQEYVTALPANPRNGDTAWLYTGKVNCTPDGDQIKNTWDVYRAQNQTYISNYGQPYIAPTPEEAATTGGNTTVSYNGVNEVFVGGVSKNATPRTVVLPGGGGDKDITYTLTSETGSVNFKYYDKGEVVSNTYSTATSVSIPPNVGEVVIYGKGSNWLSEPLSNLIDHSVYVCSDKVFVIGGNGVLTEVYANIDSCGIIGKWMTGQALPQSLAGAAIAATSTSLYAFGNSVSGASTKVFKSSLVGGLNDYSRYYAGVQFFTLSPEQFMLPNYLVEEGANANFYIKY